MLMIQIKDLFVSQSVGGVDTSKAKHSDMQDLQDFKKSGLHKEGRTKTIHQIRVHKMSGKQRVGNVEGKTQAQTREGFRLHV